ncbi:MAG: class I SAM-dependent methyltransferase [Burkholderiaceae bacterium]
MKTNGIRFQDGNAYERYMGAWSRLAGETFVGWLGAASGQRWLDVGCGNGAFTETLIECCAPASVEGVDPSPEQLVHARARPALQAVQFREGDAMALPYPDGVFDVAVMPLVIFFVRDPAKGVAEMARVVCPGGIVAAYSWDLDGGGFPYEPLLAEIRELGIGVPVPPSPQASRIDVQQDLWAGAGLEAIETCQIEVHRTFADFDEFWSISAETPSVGSALSRMGDEEIARLKARVRARVPAGNDGPVTCSARVNAIKGRVPK